MSERALELIRQLKHLPGKHPQKSHGGNRGSSGGGSGNAAAAELLTTQRRKDLFAKLQQLKVTDDIESVELMGSFVSDKPEPGDIDVIFKLKPGVDAFQAEQRFWDDNKVTREESGVQPFFVHDGINEITGTNTYKWLSNNTKKRYGKDPVKVAL